MPDNTGAFVDLFVFTRAAEASYRDSTGAAQVAAVDVPRLDHDGAGVALGLLVEGRPVSNHPDVIVLAADLAGAPAIGTVLHDHVSPIGRRRMLAIYTNTPRATLEGCLAEQGHHRRIAFFPTYLPRSNVSPTRPVRFRGESWEMPDFILVDEGVFFDAGDPLHSLLVEA